MRKKIFAKKGTLILLGLAFVVLSVIFLVLFFLHGDVRVDGEYPDLASNESMECIAIDFRYPFFSFSKPISHSTTTVNIVFANNKISKISLIQSDVYEDMDAALASSSVSHADMNNSFAKTGLKADALSANYNVYKGTMSMSLYANSYEINDDSAKYFLIDGYLGDLRRDNLKQYYIEKGFSCVYNGRQDPSNK